MKIALATLCLISPFFIHAKTLISNQTVNIYTTSKVSAFPAQWQTDDISPKGEALPYESALFGDEIIRNAVNKYPKEVIKKNLDAIYLFSELQYFGISAAGTNSRERIYLKVGESTQGYTPQYIERVFHSELSSILLRNHPQLFNEKQWKSHRDNTTEISGVSAIKSGLASPRIGNPDLLSQGFLSEYAKSNVENDFNAYAGMLFAQFDELWDLSTHYPAIAEKMALTIAFYQSIDEQFEHPYFSL